LFNHGIRTAGPSFSSYIHLAVVLALPTRLVVYGHGDELALARETQIAGAFYVPCQQIVAALPAYLDAELPARDRREAARPDRRQQFRGGRRAIDPDAQLAG